MRSIDFSEIVKEAWEEFRPDSPIKTINDISAMVSTNHVYRIIVEGDERIIAKLSYFGSYDHFREDHSTINILANNLPTPHENFLSKSLTKEGELFTYRYQNSMLDVWVVFYQPIEVRLKLPKKQEETTIVRLGEELALFHKACHETVNLLPPFTKTMQYDLLHLKEIMTSDLGRYLYRDFEKIVHQQCDTLLENLNKLGYEELPIIPVFVDWNIGNFSLTEDLHFFSRWDYDWFRVSSRVMDFYFFSRVVSTDGDKTIFSYTLKPMMEDRFLLFLQAYHKIFPLTEKEIWFIKEAYRFFILNYVVKDGSYFFHEIYASRLRMEAFQTYFPDLDKEFDLDKLLKALNL